MRTARTTVRQWTLEPARFCGLSGSRIECKAS